MMTYEDLISELEELHCDWSEEINMIVRGKHYDQEQARERLKSIGNSMLHTGNQLKSLSKKEFM